MVVGKPRWPAEMAMKIPVGNEYTDLDHLEGNNTPSAEPSEA